ncbi:hypothetical protein [Paenibacillus sp. Marseille-Q7038]
MEQEDLEVWEREISSRVEYLEQEADKLEQRIRKAEFKDNIMSNAMNKFADDEEQVNFIKHNYMNESNETVKSLNEEYEVIIKELKFQNAVLQQIERANAALKEEED